MQVFRKLSNFCFFQKCIFVFSYLKLFHDIVIRAKRESCFHDLINLSLIVKAWLFKAFLVFFDRIEVRKALPIGWHSFTKSFQNPGAGIFPVPYVLRISKTQNLDILMDICLVHQFLKWTLENMVGQFWVFPIFGVQMCFYGFRKHFAKDWHPTS